MCIVSEAAAALDAIEFASESVSSSLVIARSRSPRS